MGLSIRRFDRGRLRHITTWNRCLPLCPALSRGACRYCQWIADDWHCGWGLWCRYPSGGVRPQDMIAVPLSRDIRMLVVATPEYFPDMAYLSIPTTCLTIVVSGCGCRTVASIIGSWGTITRVTDGCPCPFCLQWEAGYQTGMLLGLGVGFISEWFIEKELRSGKLIAVLSFGWWLAALRLRPSLCSGPAARADKPYPWAWTGRYAIERVSDWRVRRR